MRMPKKGAVCQVLPTESSGSTIVALAEPAPLKRVKSALEGSGFVAQLERQGGLWFLGTNAEFDQLPSVLLDHFETYYRYESAGPKQVKITDADGRVEYDDCDDEDDGSLF